MAAVSVAMIVAASRSAAGWGQDPGWSSRGARGGRVRHLGV
ncbi:hypothetical protein [Actinoallomurus acanthiterrae]